MNNHSKTIFLTMLVLLCVSFSGRAQFVNEGVLHVGEGALVSTWLDFENRSGANLHNDGLMQFRAGLLNAGSMAYATGIGSQVQLLGAAGQQVLEGLTPIRVNNLLLNHQATAGFNLSGILEVGGVSEFRRGIVVGQEDPDTQVRFVAGGSHVNSSDASFVDGYVSAAFSDSFLYPVGDDVYRRYLSVRSADGTALDFRGRYLLEDAAILYPRDQVEPPMDVIDDAEYWELINGGDAEDIELTLSWREVTTPAFVLGDLTELVITRWDAASSRWVSLGGTVDEGAREVRTAVSHEGLGIYTLGVETGATNLGVSKTSFGKAVWEGDEFDYEIRLQNNSVVDATDVVLIDNLPDGLDYVSVSGTSAFGLMDFDVDVMGQTIMITIPELIGGDEAVFTLTVRAARPGEVVNTVSVESLQGDEDEADNTDTDRNEIRSFFITNVITPNGDGMNDSFEIKGLSKYRSNKLVIFNRWGDDVFEAENYQQDWKATGLTTGTYFYVLEVIDENGEPQDFKGWIQVIQDED